MSKPGVLFVCRANRCRSPLAHGIFIELLRRRNLEDRFLVDSAGTWAANGQEPHHESVRVAREHGVDLSVAGLSRSIEPNDLQSFEHILVMDRANLADLQRFRRLSAFGTVDGPFGQVRLLRQVVDPRCSGVRADVPDPVGGGRASFAELFAIVHDACVRLVSELSGDP